MLPWLLVLLTGGASDVVTPEDNAERYIRPNPTDGGTVAARLRPTLPTNE
jgi:hypothetical protein